MKVAIRVDASSQIGTGHFMRCLTLADALKEKGASIRFLSRHLPEHMQKMVETRGHEGKLINQHISSKEKDYEGYAGWLGTSQEVDAESCKEALSDQSWDWLIVDHYALDACWETALRSSVEKIMVIDDLANRLHDCDLLLDQNFYADMSLRYTGKVPALCRLLLGPRYALLRDEFRQLHEQAKSCSEPVKRVLVFFGGIDSDNYTDLAIEAVANINIPDLQVDVVIGAQHPCRAQIEEKCIQHGFFCHVQTNRMAELMAEADLSIGAGGSTVWERCCMGLPTFAIRTAENQRKQLIDAAVEGLLYTTKTGDDPLDTIKRHLQVLLENTSLRSLISRNSLQAVDGRGISRIVRALECSTLSIRFAELPDSENLFLWRNHPTIRDASFNAEPILWKDHQEWMKAVLSSKDKLLLIGERFNTPVGVIRFDLRGEEADVSIYLVPGIDEPGLGSSLLRSAELWLADTHPDICKILAKVLGFNKKSQNLFLGHKYEVESICYSKRQNLNEFRN